MAKAYAAIYHKAPNSAGAYENTTKGVNLALSDGFRHLKCLDHVWFVPESPYPGGLNLDDFGPPYFLCLEGASTGVTNWVRQIDFNGPVLRSGPGTTWSMTLRGIGFVSDIRDDPSQQTTGTLVQLQNVRNLLITRCAFADALDGHCLSLGVNGQATNVLLLDSAIAMNLGQKWGNLDGVHIENGNNITIRNTLFNDHGQTGLYWSGPQPAGGVGSILGCRFEESPDPYYNLDLDYVNAVTFAQNFLHATATRKNAIRLRASTRECIIERNRLSGSDAVITNAGSNNVIVDNLKG